MLFYPIYLNGQINLEIIGFTIKNALQNFVYSRGSQNYRKNFDFRCFVD